MANRNLYRTNQRLRFRPNLLIILLILLGARGAVWGQTQSAGAADSLAAWGKIVTVLRELFGKHLWSCVPYRDDLLALVGSETPSSSMLPSAVRFHYLGARVCSAVLRSNP